MAPLYRRHPLYHLPALLNLNFLALIDSFLCLCAAEKLQDNRQAARHRSVRGGFPLANDLPNAEPLRPSTGRCLLCHTEAGDHHRRTTQQQRTRREYRAAFRSCYSPCLSRIVAHLVHQWTSRQKQGQRQRLETRKTKLHGTKRNRQQAPRRARGCQVIPCVRSPGEERR